jgi:DUF218 domain
MTALSSCLIIVCGHAVFHGTDPRLEEHWALQSFQRASASKPSEHLTFLRHIEESIAIVNNSKEGHNLIVFSGAATNTSHPAVSEAEGYLKAAEWLVSQRFSQSSAPLQPHFAIEEHATDTFQNVLFSILKFYDLKQTYPTEIVVVTHAFKSQRIALHLDAIVWTKSFRVHGIDPQFDGRYFHNSLAPNAIGWRYNLSTCSYQFASYSKPHE